jgi:HK97 family phage prohead protease
MPYFVTDESPDCDGWAVVKSDGEVLGCHTTKSAALSQMIAVSLSEDIEPGGELDDDDESDERQVDLTIPDYIREAAAQGVGWYEDGLAGDGVVDRTVREAREMADGNVSEDKVIRVSAWVARHEADLQADGARPGEDGFPTPGAVAHYLWGIPTGAQYDDARAWFDRKAAQIREEEGRMLPTPVQPRTKGADVEFRSFTSELRAEPDSRVVSGYAAVFNSPSQPLPFIERIAPGAFTRALRERRRDIRAYVNHDSTMVLGSRRSGTLELWEDERGLGFRLDLPETSYANDLRNLMAAGIVDRMSFGFTVARRGERWSDDGSERTLTAVNLHEVSIVTGFPAYEATSAALRSLERLSERTGVAVDELQDALDALADGQLDGPKAALLLDAIQQVAPAEPEAEPEVTAEPEPENLLGLKQKHLELLAKKF